MHQHDSRDAGAAGVEYAILASVVAAVIAATVLLVGQDTVGMFASIAGAF